MTDLNINDIFSVLAQSKEAVDALPKIKEENSHLYEMVGTLEEQKHSAESRISVQEQQIAELQAKLKGMEDAYHSATFRETETRSKLEAFRSMVSGALGTVTDAVTEVEHKVDAAVEIVTKPDAPQGDGGVMEPTEVRSEAGNDQSGSMSQSDGSASAASTHGNSDQPAPEVAKPSNSGKAHWEKPSETSWEDWHHSGGEVPYWINTNQFGH